MSHARPKETSTLIQNSHEAMEFTDMREQLVVKLKLAYKKMNSLNAATRKINAVMAILFMKRDKAKSDVESLARKLSRKIVLMQNSFEKEITEIVDQKVKSMEDQVQFLFDELYTLGETCVEAEKVLKIQNEENLTKDGPRLSEKFNTLLDKIQEGEELGDLEEAMFLQFVPGNLELDSRTFGQIYSSNKDSGVSFTTGNSTGELEHCDISPVADNQGNQKSDISKGASTEGQLLLCSKMEKDRLMECQRVLMHDLLKHNPRDEVMLKSSDMEKIPRCPPGFKPVEPQVKQPKPPVFEYVSKHPSKALAQSTPIAKGKTDEDTSKESKDENVDAQKSNVRESRSIANAKKVIMSYVAQVTTGKDNPRQLPAISEKWEEEIGEIHELSSAMSVRLRKNIYDRMRSDNRCLSSDERVDNPTVPPSDLTETKGLSEKPLSSEAEAQDYQQKHVRKLFDEEKTVHVKQEKNWNDYVKMTSGQPNPFSVKSFQNSQQKTEWNDYGKMAEGQQNPFSIRGSQNPQKSASAKPSSKPNEWWDAQLVTPKQEPKCHDEGSNGKQTKKVTVSADNKKTGSPFSSTGIVDNWEELDDSSKFPFKSTKVKQLVHSTGVSSSVTKSHKVWDSDGREVILIDRKDDAKKSWKGVGLQKTENSCFRTVVDYNHGNINNITKISGDKANDTWKEEGLYRNDDLCTVVDYGHGKTNINSDSKADATPMKTVKEEPVKTSEKSCFRFDFVHGKTSNNSGEGKGDTTPKKNNNIIPGRMKSLLKSYINSNKTSTDHPKTVDSDQQQTSSADSYKSKLLKDNTVIDTPEKPKSEEESTLTSLGQVPSKSKLPDNAKLRRTVTVEESFGPVIPCKDLKPETIPLPPTPPAFDDSAWCEEPLPAPSTDHQSKPKPTQPSKQPVHEVKLTSAAPMMPKKPKVFTDLTKLIFTGNSWSELPAVLERKIGHLKKGDEDGFFFPIGVGYTSTGDFVVADTGNNRVKIIKNGVFTTIIGKDGPSMNRPSAVVLNERDEIFVKDDHQIFKFDLSGKLLLQIGRNNLKRPYGLAMTMNGYLVTLDITRNNHVLYLFDQDGNVYRHNVFGPLMNNMINSKCRFLEVYNDKVLVSDLGLSVMYLGNLNGHVFRCFGYHGSAPGMLREPSGVAVDSAGNWIIADSKNDRIQVFSPEGQYLFPIKLSEPIYRPSDITFTADQHLLIVNYLTHSVKVYKLG